MARRRGFFAELQRDLERQRVQAERAYRAALREQERQEREALRQVAADEREYKRRYAEARQREAEALERHLERRLQSLDGLLDATLHVDDYIDLDTLKPTWKPPRFDGGSLSRREPEPELEAPEAPRG
jgi:restriction system protein